MFECEIVIDKPIHEVYAAWNAVDNKPRWLAGLKRLEPISGTPGAVGSKTRHVYEEQGHVVELIETVTAHEPGKCFAGDLDGQGVRCSIEVRFLEEERHTRLCMRSDVRSISLKTAMLLPLFRGAIHKRQESDLRRFKQLVERGEL